MEYYFLKLFQHDSNLTTFESIAIHHAFGSSIGPRMCRGCDFVEAGVETFEE